MPLGVKRFIDDLSLEHLESTRPARVASFKLSDIVSYAFENHKIEVFILAILTH